MTYQFAKRHDKPLFIHDNIGKVRYFVPPNAWELLFGFVLARAEDEKHAVILQMHPTKNVWTSKQVVLGAEAGKPVDEQFGGLPEMMAAFEKMTRLELPPVMMCKVGLGAEMVSSRGAKFDQANPFGLVEGKRYEKLKLVSGAAHDFVVENAPGRGLMLRRMDGEKPAPVQMDPALMLSPVSWQQVVDQNAAG